MSSLEIDYHIWQSTCRVYTFVDFSHPQKFPVSILHKRFLYYKANPILSNDKRIYLLTTKFSTSKGWLYMVHMFPTSFIFIHGISKSINWFYVQIVGRLILLINITLTTITVIPYHYDHIWFSQWQLCKHNPGLLAPWQVSYLNRVGMTG